MEGKTQTPEQIIADQHERIANLEGKVNALLELVGKNDASAPVEKKSKPVIPAEPVTVGKKKYMFKFPTFYFGTKHYEAQDAALDAALLTSIVATEGQGLLAEVF
jgi:hypothetical protein